MFTNKNKRKGVKDPLTVLHTVQKAGIQHTHIPRHLLAPYGQQYPGLVGTKGAKRPTDL